MLLKVNPTRMELQRLKKRLKLAGRGYDLLKNKQDELMRKFLAMIEDAKRMRHAVEEGLARYYRHYTQAHALMRESELKAALATTDAQIAIDFEMIRIMNLKIPKIKATIEGDIYSYGYMQTSSELDQSAKILKEIFPDLMKLAEIEGALGKIANEIEKTRRRVNALEYIMIPSIEETISYISMKLQEIERSNLSRLMKVKELYGRTIE